MLVNTFAARKKSEGRWGKHESEGALGAISGCSSGCALRREKEEDRRAELSFWLCCALGAPLSARDWWMGLFIARYINPVLLSLSFVALLPHHSSLYFCLQTPHYPPPPPPAAAAPGPSLVPLFRISFQKASLMLTEREGALWGSKKAKRADRYLYRSFSCLQAAWRARELDCSVVFHGGGGGAGGKSVGQAGQMEDSIQHLGHCLVDMKELSANAERISTAGELPALVLSACLSAAVSSLPPATNSASHLSAVIYILCVLLFLEMLVQMMCNLLTSTPASICRVLSLWLTHAEFVLTEGKQRIKQSGERKINLKCVFPLCSASMTVTFWKKNKKKRNDACFSVIKFHHGWKSSI